MSDQRCNAEDCCRVFGHDGLCDPGPTPPADERWTLRYVEGRPVVWNCPSFWATADAIELVPEARLAEALRERDEAREAVGTYSADIMHLEECLAQEKATRLGAQFRLASLTEALASIAEWDADLFPEDGWRMAAAARTALADLPAPGDGEQQ